MTESVFTMSDEKFLEDGPSLHEAFLQAEEETATEPEEVILDETVEEVTEEAEEVDLAEETIEPEVADDALDEDDLDEEAEVEGETETSEEVSTGSESEDLSLLLKPFKADGKQVQARSVAEALQLQQMGAHYTQRMQALKPHLRHIKTLEKNDLLDEEKLNFLIDLSNKEPAAIAKLVKESEINPVDLVEGEDSAVEYTPNNHHVSESAMQLEEVLSSIEHSSTYSKCIEVIGNQWDEGSQRELNKHPEFIRDINSMMESGVYDKIDAEVQHLRTFGGLSGLSALDAFKQVGASMLNSGKLNDVQPERKPVATTKIKTPDAKREQKRKAASPSKKAIAVAKPAAVSPLTLPDEEWLKLEKLNL